MKKFDNFCSNLDILSHAGEQDLSNEFIQSGIVDKFALQFELSWKLLKVLLQYEGDPLGNTVSPREVLKGAYRCYDFIDQDLWLDMLHDRNVIEHTYDAKEMNRVLGRVLQDYIPAFAALRDALREHYGTDLDRMA